MVGTKKLTQCPNSRLCWKRVSNARLLLLVFEEFGGTSGCNQTRQRGNVVETRICQLRPRGRLDQEDVSSVLLSNQRVICYIFN
ncbi:hypothetical protein CAJAP_11003 [Camponotus japonicus]